MILIILFFKKILHHFLVSFSFPFLELVLRARSTSTLSHSVNKQKPSAFCFVLRGCMCMCGVCVQKIPQLINAGTPPPHKFPEEICISKTARNPPFTYMKLEHRFPSGGTHTPGVRAGQLRGMQKIISNGAKQVKEKTAKC